LCRLIRRFELFSTREKAELNPTENQLARFKTENEMLKLSVYNHTDACRRIKIERTDLQDRLEDAKNKSEQNKLFGNDVAESLTRNLKEAQAKKELEEHDFKNQINSLLRKIEQLENTITEERAAKKVEMELKDEKIRVLQNKVDSMEEVYQNVLADSFDNLGQEVNNLQVEFEDEALDYLNKYGSMLLDMGLSPAALKAEFSNIKGRVRL